jgi:molecular chaperone GrpE
MVLKQFKDVLEKYGVREVQAFGEPFDPNVHEAMMHEMEEDFDDNTVIEVFQKGFIFKDRLLRPSMVKVSKKPEKKVDAGMKEDE